MAKYGEAACRGGYDDYSLTRKPIGWLERATRKTGAAVVAFLRTLNDQQSEPIMLPNYKVDPQANLAARANESDRRTVSNFHATSAERLAVLAAREGQTDPDTRSVWRLNPGGNWLCLRDPDHDEGVPANPGAPVFDLFKGLGGDGLKPFPPEGCSDVTRTSYYVSLDGAKVWREVTLGIVTPASSQDEQRYVPIRSLGDPIAIDQGAVEGLRAGMEYVFPY